MKIRYRCSTVHKFEVVEHIRKIELEGELFADRLCIEDMVAIETNNGDDFWKPKCLLHVENFLKLSKKQLEAVNEQIEKEEGYGNG